MKKHKRVSRSHKPLAPTPKLTRTSGGTKRAGLRWIGGLAGVGIFLVIGYLATQKHAPPVRSDLAIAEVTNRPTPAPIQQPIDLNNVPENTNRPGSVVNREAEGRADDLNNQGTRFLAAGDFLHAVQSYQQAITLKPDDEDLHFNLAIAFTRTGDITNAEHEYNEALRLLPDYPEAHNNYGNLLSHLGRMDEAEAQFEEAISEMPDSAEFNNNLGVLWQRMHKTNDAMQSFQKAVQCDTNYLESHYNLAMSYLARKKPESAIAELQQALRIKPDFEPAQRALARVTSKP